MPRSVILSPIIADNLSVRICNVLLSNADYLGLSDTVTIADLIRCSEPNSFLFAKCPNISTKSRKELVSFLQDINVNYSL